MIYGEEVKFGGGKVIRDGMGQGQMTADDCGDLVLTNALIVDHWGIGKADIGGEKGGGFCGGCRWWRWSLPRDLYRRRSSS